MTKYQLLNQLTVGVLWLVLGAGCQKDPPEPNPSGCRTGSTNSDLKFVVRLNGVLLQQFSSNFIVLQTPIKDPRLSTSSNEIYGDVVCPLSSNYIENIVAERKQDPNGSTRQYKLWGVIYEDYLSIPINPGTRAYLFQVDKIEKAL